MTFAELSLRMGPDFLKFFEKIITDEHGKGFSFRQEGDSFIAEKITPETTGVVFLELMNEGLENVNAKKFLKEHFDRKNSLSTRVFGVFKGLLGDHDTMDDFLKLDADEVLHRQRNYGRKAHSLLDAKFREFGFDTEKYPVFKPSKWWPKEK